MTEGAYFCREMRTFYLQQILLCMFMGVVGVLLEFLPRHLTLFIEGDLTISHHCGNTVRLAFGTWLVITCSTVGAFIYYFIVIIAILVFVYQFSIPSDKSSVCLFVFVEW